MNYVDFYAGAGGWDVGLTLAGLAHSFSGEIWKPANRTREANLGTPAPVIDVRNLDHAHVPDADLIVGSPPCTQFSFANRGGNGDIDDGLEDVLAFLRIVRAKNPRYWVMENVPRLTEILSRELRTGGALSDFADLFDHVDDFDMSAWGVPQRRRRCIAGRYPREALLALAGRRAPTLAETVAACAAGRDPTWDHDPEFPVTDNVPPVSLAWEEERINREKKDNHPIYNDMSFPDDPHRPARTVTATCTKVSRESIVVPDGRGGHRLLSVRESAALQSFPASFQFTGTRSNRIKMAGNAIPPLFTYFVGLAATGSKAPAVLPRFVPACGPAADAAPENEERRPHRPGRAFRSAFRDFRFKSGMSFELRNGPRGWEVTFNSGGFGRPRVASPEAIARAASMLPVPALTIPEPGDMQAAWQASQDRPDHPFRVMDAASAAALAPRDTSRDAEAVTALYGEMGLEPSPKAMRNVNAIAAGAAMARAFNEALRRLPAAEAA